MMHVVKLDRRYRGFGHWTHRAESRGWWGDDHHRRVFYNFYDQRRFLTQMHGAGAWVDEAGAIVGSGEQVPVWGFDMEGNLYLRDDALVSFELAKERWA